VNECMGGGYIWLSLSCFLKSVEQISLKYSIGHLQEKMLGQVVSYSYWSIITCTLCEVQIKKFLRTD